MMNAIDLDQASRTPEARTNGAKSMSEIICRLNIGDEIFIEPERIVPFEHWLGHIPFAFWLVGALRPRRLVELGTHRGNSYCTFCQAISYHDLDCSAYAVDTWQGDTHMLPEEGLLAELKRYHDPLYGSFSSLIEMTFDGAREHFAPNSIDLLHIDGTHTYDAVRSDFESWLPTLSDRAVVLFHDINVRQNDFGVWRLWDELSGRYPSFSFVHSHGLGVLGVGSDLPAAVRALFGLHDEPDLAGRVRRLFAVRGAGVLQRLRAQTFQEDAESNEAEVIEANARNVAISEQVEEARRLASVTAAALAEVENRCQKLIQSETEAQTNLSLLRSELQVETVRKDRALEEARVSKILLFQERERAERVVERLRENSESLKAEFNAEVGRLTAELHMLHQEINLRSEREDRHARQLQEVYKSTSWRAALPLRLASRVVRGEWAELAQLYRAKRRLSD